MKKVLWVFVSVAYGHQPCGRIRKIHPTVRKVFPGSITVSVVCTATLVQAAADDLTAGMPRLSIT
jgi:hypothetical protein